MAAEPNPGSEIQATRLPGGLFVISERLRYLKSASLGVAFHLGSRDDPPGQEGMTHLIEHMIFKGTEEMDARAINIASESRGAELNAFTDKEATCFYARFPGENMADVTGLLTEILRAPAFRNPELEKEKQVVMEEIYSGEEDPESCMINLLMQAVYGTAPLGKTVLGTAESINRINENNLGGFYQGRYGAGCAVAVAVGDLEHQKVVDMVRVLDAKVGMRPVRESAQFRSPGFLTRTRRELSQVYVCLARPAFAYTDPRRYALAVLNTALGGGVSSRLFQRLRETEGLVYSIGSFVELYEDSGLLGIYFIAEHRKLARCIAVLREEIERLRREGITEEEFKRAVTMIRSGLVLGSESSIGQMMRLARGYLIAGRVVTLEEILARYDRLELAEVTQLVGELLGEDSYYAGVVGPVGEKEVGEILGG